MRTILPHFTLLLIAAIPLPAIAAELETKNNADSSNPTAADLRKAAHDARDVWHNFPGFSANIVVSEDNERYEGTIDVGADFEYVLNIDKAAEKPWLKSKLRSVISHRRPDEGPHEYKVTFQDQGPGHAGGRLIAEDDGSGVFRIQNGEIKEVIRRNESSWFEITTLENFTTPAGKVLPQTTSVTFRDPDTGNIESNLANYFGWKKVGNFYLPDNCDTVKVGGDGQRSTRKLEFTGHQLHLPAPQQVQLHKAMPESLTSFGAAVLGDYLYVFSGHDGDAHGFGVDVLADHFRRIKFDDPNAQWEELAKHEPSQSTALVTDGKYLYRIGGLSFLNQGEEDTNFNSTAHFSRYDVEKNEWTELAPLPEPRSSLDAAVLGRHIYVAAGWNLQGESSEDAPWHDDMLRFDLDNPEKGWESLPGPGYQTRAISLAAHDGKIYLLGGIQPKGITRKVSVYDPQKNSWSEGPELKADSSTSGFATSSFATGGQLYVVGGSGVVYRLSDDGNQWEVDTRLMYPRMFLRLLPAADDRLLAVGGISTTGGRMAVVESVNVPSQSDAPHLLKWSVPFDGKAKHSQTVVLDGGKLYAVGGNASRSPHDFSPGAFVNEAFVFDIGSQSVERLPDMPYAMQSGAGVAQSLTSKHDQIVVLGGLGMNGEQFGSLTGVLSLNPKAKTWSVASSSLPQPRGMFQAVTFDDAIWSFGGSNAGKGGGLNTDIVHWWGDESSIAPLPGVVLPHARRSFGGARLGDEYFLVGGLAEGTKIAEAVDVFNFNDRTWREIASPNRHRVFPSLTSDGERLYLFGGFSNTNGHFAPEPSLEVYDPASNRWTILAESIEGVDPSMTLRNFGGRLLFYGIDKEVDGQANFVLLDPTPKAQPKEVAGMSFSGPRSGRGNKAVADAKSMMRKDADKDGKLSAEELGDRLASLIESGDQDSDGLLSQDELVKALQKQNDTEKEDDSDESKQD
ncbi:DUF3386 family protein [Blastopirellula marina]|uniref:EF-hand domain-containing protein n=1 Tax=Blastopirellula marina TaxID=124 RepID=A0A2S8F9J6_9BACT|nr:DUF3386 family protein [Blastopirellula marina]PQO28829.1 hypothetical protein C5Y98_23985 [Blastopirellula marina]PTL42102.1 DUF3386 domain-containing protein [Blastopirellula marina]